MITLSQIEGIVSIFAGAEPEVQAIITDIAGAVKSQPTPAVPVVPTPAVPSLPTISSPEVAKIISFLPQLLTLEQQLAQLFSPPKPVVPATPTPPAAN